MRRTVLAFPLAIVALVGWPTSHAYAQDTKTARGSVTAVAADSVTVARRGGTTKLGHLLAPMAVRYVALPARLAPGPHAGPRSPLPAATASTS